MRHPVNRKRTLGCKHEVRVTNGWHAWHATVTTDRYSEGSIPPAKINGMDALTLKRIFETLR